MSSVLVVDDEFGVAEVLESILADEGYTVAIAVNGRQGLKRLAEMPIDAIFLDYMMPVLDGPGMLEALQAEPAWRNIPVIMMSSLPEEAVAARAGGYVAFLRKPFRVALVLATLERVLRRNRSP